MAGKQLIKLLKQNGWELERIQCSHHILVKGSKTLSVPVHGSSNPGKGLLRPLKDWPKYSIKIYGLSLLDMFCILFFYMQGDN